MSAYAGFMLEAPTRLDCFYDASELPHPKEAIVAAIERGIVRSPLEKQVELLQAAGAFMWNFLEGIGPDPRPPEGYSRLPQGKRRQCQKPHPVRQYQKPSNFDPPPILDLSSAKDKSQQRWIPAAASARLLTRGSANNKIMCSRSPKHAGHPLGALYFSTLLRRHFPAAPRL